MKSAEVHIQPSAFWRMTDKEINAIFNGGGERRVSHIVINSSNHIGSKPYPLAKEMSVEGAKEYLAGEGSIEIRDPDVAIYIPNPNVSTYQANVDSRYN